MPARRSALLALAALLGLTTACGATAGDAGGGGGPFTIGVVLEVTGAAASIGGPERQAVELAVERANAAGGVGGRDIEMIILDAQSREDQAAKYASQLVTQDGVDILIGSSRSGPSLAMRPIAEQNEIPMISLAASERIIAGSPWVFKTPPSDRVVVDQLVRYAADAGYRNIGLLRDSSAFGEGVASAIEASGAPLGVRVAVEEKFDPAATDFAAQLIRLRAASADANLLWGSAAAPALATKAYRELGLRAPLLSSYGIATQSFLDTAGAQADGMVLTGNKLLVADQLPAADPQRQALLDFTASFQGKYGARPTPFAGYAWDAVNLAVHTARTTGTAPADLRAGLERTTGFAGVTGVYDFSAADHSGLPTSPLTVLEVRAGSFTLKAGVKP